MKARAAALCNLDDVRAVGWRWSERHRASGRHAANGGGEQSGCKKCFHEHSFSSRADLARRSCCTVMAGIWKPDNGLMNETISFEMVRRKGTNPWREKLLFIHHRDFDCSVVQGDQEMERRQFLKAAFVFTIGAAISANARAAPLMLNMPIPPDEISHTPDPEAAVATQEDLEAADLVQARWRLPFPRFLRFRRRGWHRRYRRRSYVRRTQPRSPSTDGPGGRPWHYWHRRGEYKW